MYLLKIVQFIMLTVFLCSFASGAIAKVKVVASVPAFAAIAEEIGGDRVEVESLSKGYQDPHFVDAKPSYVLKLNRADMLIYNGLDLEIGWLPILVTGARNSKILPGNTGNLDCSTLIPNLLEVPTTRVDRSMGDIHPGGNPHYMLDPKNGIAVASGIASRLKELDSKNASFYDERLRDFIRRLNAKTKEWEAKLSPYKGTQVVTYHKSWVYLSNWAGLQEMGYVEPKPGIPPSPSYVADLIRKMRQMDVKLIIVESYYPRKVPALISEKTGSSLLVLPASVGGRDGINTYFDLLDVIVDEVTTKLKNTEQSVSHSSQAGG
ncbi:MAG TPA: metal ABC transporter substrate-binding protein [Thermodesulfobacteriota bacterium]|nr:metal ABC transporter substrate-binding protein [Thermodesulfobacteriota bacterium]